MAARRPPRPRRRHPAGRAAGRCARCPSRRRRVRCPSRPLPRRWPSRRTARGRHPRQRPNLPPRSQPSDRAPTSPPRCRRTSWRRWTSSSGSGSPATSSRRPRARRTRSASRGRRRASALGAGHRQVQRGVAGTGTDVFDLPSGGGISELSSGSGRSAGRSGHDRGTPGHRAEREHDADRDCRQQGRGRHRAGRGHRRRPRCTAGSTPPSSRACRASTSTSARSATAPGLPLRPAPRAGRAVPSRSSPPRSRTASERSPRSSTTSPRSGRTPARAQGARAQAPGHRRQMFDELFPEDMQAHLWSNGRRSRTCIVYADEPFVPWELVHLKPPTGPREEKARFLAQGGMVRWQPGASRPGRCTSARGARVAVPGVQGPALRPDRAGATRSSSSPTASRRRR